VVRARFGLGELLIRTARLAGDADEEALVDEAVGDGGGGTALESIGGRGL
jgi:hypothetical protein